MPENQGWIVIISTPLKEWATGHPITAQAATFDGFLSADWVGGFNNLSRCSKVGEVSIRVNIRNVHRINNYNSIFHPPLRMDFLLIAGDINDPAIFLKNVGRFDLDESWTEKSSEELCR